MRTLTNLQRVTKAVSDMTRYIDVDGLIKEIILLCQLAQKRVRDTPGNSPVYERYSTQLQDRERILRIINAQPTADVVPRSEYDALAEQNESLEIELENMRRNLGDAREGWNDAECEVERLREINSLLTEAMQVKQEWQRRYNNAKAEVAREIFEEIEKLLRIGVVEHLDCLNAYVKKGYTELKKKYTEGEG